VYTVIGNIAHIVKEGSVLIQIFILMKEIIYIEEENLWLSQLSV